MARRQHADQLAFDFPAPVLWAAALPIVAPAPFLGAAVLEPDPRGVIDYRPLVMAVKSAHADTPFRDWFDLVTRDLIDWHGGQTNEYGCYASIEEVVLASDGDARAVARLTVTGRGHWICGYDLRCGTHRSSGPANVTNESGAVSREAALLDFASRNATWFEKERVTLNSCAGLPARRQAERMADKLRAYAQAA